MNRSELVSAITNKLREDGYRKKVDVPKRTLYISDNEGGHCSIDVKAKRRIVLYNGEDVKRVIDALLDIVVETLMNGEEISISGYGVLTKVRRAPRDIVSITGEQLHVDEKYAPKFEPGKFLRDAVNFWHERTLEKSAAKAAQKELERICNGEIDTPPDDVSEV